MIDLVRNNIKYPNPYNHRIMRTCFGYFDLDCKGYIVLNRKYKNLFKIMLFEQFPNDGYSEYYRGENNKYSTFLPSWKRLKTKEEKCLWWLKKREFKDWFLSTPYFEHFAYRFEYAENPETVPEGSGKKFCFDFEAIAQHYEFPTNYLDITTKYDVAKFFAYTYWDEKIKSYKPITRKYHPVLYRAKMADIIKYDSSIFQIVGFQACLRPLAQQAMTLDLSNENKTIRQDLFEQIHLENTEEKAQEVFNKFNGGKLLFPEESILELKNTIDESNTIHQSCVNRYADTFKIPYHKVRPPLCKNFEIQISNKENNLSRTLMYKMKEEFDNKMKPWVKKEVCYRLATRVY